jgi:DNA-binding NarL/FixJ family response regulator
MCSAYRGVLIVDDNPVVRSALRGFIENVAKVPVSDEVADGYAAIESAKRAPPQLVLMDVSMPRLNGVAAASIISKIAPETRIILFTLYADDLGESLARAAGVDLVISKSDGAAALIAALRSMLPPIGARASSPRTASND